MRARNVAQAGVIAAVYAALTFLVIQFMSVFSFGIVQFRLSEALTVVACLTPAAIPGLFIGSALANLSSVAAFGAIGLSALPLAGLLSEWAEDPVCEP